MSYSSANSVISSHSKFSAKNTSIHPQSANSQQGGGGYGQRAKQAYQQEIEKEDDDLMKRYMEQQEKHRQLMSQNQKRRKEQEKKLKEEADKKKKKDEEELLKRKESKQTAYMKFLRNNANQVADNLKQNVVYGTNPNHGQPSKMPKANTVQGQKRTPVITNNVEASKTSKEDTSKPKRQWNKQATDEVQREIKYGSTQNNTNEKNIQKTLKKEKRNLDALDLNIEDNFEKIKKMYERKNQESGGNDFIVNFEKEWKDEEESQEGLKQSKLLDSLDLSALVQKKKPVHHQQSTFVKKDSEIQNIEEIESDEDDKEDFRQKENKKQTAKNDNNRKEPPNKIEALVDKKEGGKSKKRAEMLNKNDSALVREAIGFGFDEESDEESEMKNLGFQKTKQDKENTKNKDKEKVGLTEEMLHKHNDIIDKKKLTQDDKKYDVLSWAKGHEKEVEDVFSTISGKGVLKNQQPGVQKVEKQQAQKINVQVAPSKQEENKLNIQLPKFKQSTSKEENTERLSEISQKIGNSKERARSKQREEISDERSERKERKNDFSRDVESETSKKTGATKAQQLPPQIPIPPSKQKYSTHHQVKAQSKEGVSKCKSKLQMNVENARRNRSPESACSRDDDLNIDEFMRDDLININKEEQELQKEIYQLHFDNVEKIREIENKNNININLVSSKQIKELQSNKQTQPIKPLYECNEDELEQSLQRLDFVLAKKQAAISLDTPPPPQNVGGYASLRQQQQIQGQDPLFNHQNMQNQAQFQQPAASNLIMQQMMILQQQQQLLFQQQQQIAAANGLSIPMSSVPQLISSSAVPSQNIQQPNATSMKVQSILSANQLTVNNLQEQKESLTKIEYNQPSNSNLPPSNNKKKSAWKIQDDQKSQSSQLNNNIKNVSSNISIASTQKQNAYDYDVFDLDSASQIGQDNLEQRRKKLKEELDEEVESELGTDLKSQMQQQKQDKSYAKKYLTKKDGINNKKKDKKSEDKQLLQESESASSEGVLKFNPKLKALLLGGVEEDSDEQSRDNENENQRRNDSFE